jgi:tRNA A-37 threonylcarbamoyl transferase component Bud32
MNGYRSAKFDDGWKVYIENGRCSQELLNQVEDFISSNNPPHNWIQAASSDNSKVWKLFVGEGCYIFKEYVKRGPLDPLKLAVAGSRARKAWSAGLELISKGFATPDMPIWGEKLRWRIPYRNFLVTSFIPNAHGLYTLLRGKFNPPLNEEKLRIKRSLIYALGNMIGRLHSSGIVHGDLRLDNILVQNWRDRKHNFYLIDNERNTLYHKIPERLIIKNLVQLSMISSAFITHSDRMRFLNAYLSSRKDLQVKKKYVAQEIYDRTVKRMKKRHHKYGD